jgi:membrane-associated phospholipid phosphatase
MLEPTALAAAWVRRLAALALLCVLALGAVYAVAVRTTTGQEVEDAALSAVGDRPELQQRADDDLRDLTERSLVVAAVVVVAIALVQRRPRLAVALVVLVGGSILTTEALKRVLLVRPPLASAAGALADNSFPSGHATVATALAVAFVLAVPPPWRGIATMPAAVYASVRGWQTVTAGWHRGSDVVGAVLVVMTWACAMGAVLVARQGIGRARSDSGLATLGAAAAGITAFVGAVMAALAVVRGIDVARVVTAAPYAAGAASDALATEQLVAASAALLAIPALVLALGSVSFDPPRRAALPTVSRGNDLGGGVGRPA